MTRLYDGDTFTHRERQFMVTMPADDFGDAPWDREDGHGPVTAWTRRDKAPGEWVLNEDNGCRRFYGAQMAQLIALRDGWDAPPFGEGTPRQRAARAVEADFQRLRAWCRDEWCYVGVVVTLLDADGAKTDYSASLWGIEDDADDYLAEVARELADDLAEEATAREVDAIGEAVPFSPDSLGMSGMSPISDGRHT